MTGQFRTPMPKGGHQFLVYETAAGRHPGRILRCGVTSDVFSLADQCGPGEDWLPVHGDEARQMVDLATGKVVDRPGLPSPPPAAISLEIGEVWALDLPVGTRLRLVGEGIAFDLVETSPVLIEFDRPGRRQLFVRPPWPFPEATIAVTVSEPE